MLTEPLNVLAEQIASIQQSLTEAKHAYEQEEQRHKELEFAITYWTEQRDARIANDEREKAVFLKELADLDSELLMGNSRIVELKQAIEKRRREVGLIEDTLAHLDQQVVDAKREAARKVVESAQIVGTTLTSFYVNPVLLNQEWDVVIVDEGSMAPPPAVLVAANRARSHVIVVGDPLQLAPVCKFKDNLVKHWLGRDVFTHGGYTLDQAEQGSHHSVLLPYQGRMHSDICDLVRGPVYRGLLKDRNPKAARPKFGPEPEHAVVLYDTGSSKRARAQKPESGRSRLNEYHAEVAIKLAKQVLTDFPNKHAECIGIVTPYAAQRDLIRGKDQEGQI